MLRIVDANDMLQYGNNKIHKKCIGLVERKKAISFKPFYVNKKDIKIDGKIFIIHNIRKGISPHISWLKEQVKIKMIIYVRLTDTKENSIGLCNKCHDYVEIKTEEWIESGRYYNIDILRGMIINDGF